MTFRPLFVMACALLGACGQAAQDESGSASGEAETAVTIAAPPVAQTPGDAPAPPAAFTVCRSCHAVTPGKHGLGPSLAGVWGKEAGSAPDYAYSEALKSSGIVWNAETLDKWLQGPTKMVPGTRMVVGLPNAEGRKAVIDYLETLK